MLLVLAPTYLGAVLKLTGDGSHVDFGASGARLFADCPGTDFSD